MFIEALPGGTAHKLVRSIGQSVVPLSAAMVLDIATSFIIYANLVIIMVQQYVMEDVYISIGSAQEGWQILIKKAPRTYSRGFSNHMAL